MDVVKDDHQYRDTPKALYIFTEFSGSHLSETDYRGFLTFRYGAPICFYLAWPFLRLTVFLSRSPVPDIPRQCRFEALLDRVGWEVAEQGGCFRDIGEGVTDIACAEVAVDWLAVGE